MYASHLYKKSIESHILHRNNMIGWLKNISKDKLHYRLLVIALPIIVQNLVHYLQLQVDMAMLGHSNTLYLSAVGNVMYPYNIIISFLTALSIGVTVLIAHNVGSKSLNSARRFSEVSFFYNLLIAIPFFCILFLFPHTLMNWMGTSEQINSYASQFMKAISFSVLFLAIQLSIIAILQGTGKTRPIMIAALIATTANIFFGWVLIYGRLGFPELGIKGSGIATSISNFLSMSYLIFAFIVTKRLPFKTSLKGILNPRWSIQKKNIIVGLPYGLEAMFWTFGQIVIIRMINKIGDYAAGTYVLVSRIQAIAFFFYLGFARATMIMVGLEIGAGNRQMASRITYLSLRIAIFICLFASSVFLIFPDQILSIFTTETSLIKKAVPLLNIIAITIFPVTVNVVIGNAIRGFKDTKWMFFTQCLGTVFTISLSATLLFVFNLSLAGVFITVLCDECIRAFHNYRHFKKLIHL
jgi:putative MATE family efflux protein